MTDTKFKTVEELLDLVHKENPDDEVKMAAIWLGAVAEEKDVTPSILWHVNKEKQLEKTKKMYQYYEDVELKSAIYTGEDPIPSRSYISMIQPSGKTVPLLRYLCEHKILKIGEREATFPEVTGVYHNDQLKPHIYVRAQSPTIRGAKLEINYTKLEQAYGTIIEATNRSFALEAIADENKELLQEVEKINLKHRLSNLGHEISKDHNLITDLTIRSIQKAIVKIASEGYNITELVLCVNRKGLQDLIIDPKLDEAWEERFGERFDHSKLITVNTIQKLLDITIIQTSACHTYDYKYTIPVRESTWQRFTRYLRNKDPPVEEKTKEIVHAVLFMPRITFGLVTGEMLTMEAQRRNEMQEVHIVGTKKCGALIKHNDSLAVISYSG